MLNGTLDLLEAAPSESVIAQPTVSVACPANTTTHGVLGAVDVSWCTARAGYYVVDVAPNVALCPADWWCAGGLAPPVACPAHSSTFAAGGASSVKDCLCDAYYQVLLLINLIFACIITIMMCI